MSMRVCCEPGCPELIPAGTRSGRCKIHTSQKQQAYDKQRGSRQQRGYGIEHERLRRTWARKVAAGTETCARCGMRISPLEPWELDHTDDRTGYLGASHKLCNRRARISPGA